MDDLILAVLLIFTLLYAVGVTVALVISVINNLNKSKKLRLMEQELNSLRAAKQANTPAAAPAPQPQTQQAASTAPASHPVQTANAPVAPVYKYTYTAPVSAKAPATAPAVQAQPAAAATPVQQTPAPAPKPAEPKKPREKIKFSSINISFAVGVLLITIVGAVFISSSWNFMNDAVRAGVLIGAVALVFGLSYLSGKVLKLRQTGFAFYTLGSLLLPVITVGIGAMQLFGSWFSFKGDGAAMVAALAALLFGAAGIVGVRIYKSGAYYGIMYLGFTWTLLFTAAQFAYKIEDRLVCSYLALAGAALVTTILSLNPKSKDIKFFRLYSAVISYITLGATLVVVWDFRNIGVLLGMLFLSAVLYVRGKIAGQKWHLYVLPVMAFIISLYSTSFAALTALNDITWLETLIFTSVIVIFFIALELSKGRTIVSDILIPVAMLILSFTGSTSFYEYSQPDYFVTLALMAITTAFSAWAAHRKTNHKIVRAVMGAWTSFASMATLYSLCTWLYSKDYSQSFKILDTVNFYIREILTADTVKGSAVLTLFAFAITAYAVCSYFRGRSIAVQFASYTFLLGSIISVSVFERFECVYLALAVAAFVTSMLYSCIPAEERKTTCTILSEILMNFTIFIGVIFMFAHASFAVFAGHLFVFFTLAVRGTKGAFKWQRFVVPVFASLIGYFTVHLLQSPVAFSGDRSEILIYLITMLICYLFIELFKVRSVFSDIYMPIALLFAAFNGRLTYSPLNPSLFVVTVILIAVSCMLMTIPAWRKTSGNKIKTASGILSALISVFFIFSIGSAIFGIASAKTMPVSDPNNPYVDRHLSWMMLIDDVVMRSFMFTTCVLLVLYVICSIFLRRKTFAKAASFSYYAAGIVTSLALYIYDEKNMLIAATSLLITYALTAVVSRYIAKPEKHPDIRTACALVFAVIAVDMFLVQVFENETDELIFVIFVIVLNALTLIPQIKGHAVIGRYTGIVSIASTLFAVAAFIRNDLFAENYVLSLSLALVMLAVMYLRKNTITTIPYILIAQYSISLLLKPYDGYYVFMCILGVAMVALGYVLHRKGVVQKLYIDFISFLAILCPLNVFYIKEEPEIFAVLITAALIFASLALRIKSASKVLMSVATTAGFIAVMNLQIVSDLPDMVSGEVIMALILADVWIIRNVIKPGEESLMRGFWIAAVAICLVIEGISAAATGELIDLLVTGIVSVAIFIYAFIAKDKSWFLLSVIAIIGIAIYLSTTFWASKAWLVYLLVVGVILISMAAINEYGKRKAEQAGEKSEGQGAGVKRFFEEWKW